jgi:NAD(P)-dependent dehydrogenase (short-subunit alcohol dehydrogenase family)
MDASGVAVVTGASRGIGRAVAIELARRGFDVVATMRDPAAGAALPAAVGTGAAGTLRVELLDVNDPATIRLPTDVRVLVNNAGVEDDNLPVEVMPLDAWRRLFETNVFGLVAVTQRAVPLMRANGGGVICNIGSSSVLAPVPFMAAYRASKAAVSAFGESLLAEVQQFGIRVVEVLPGPIETDMLASSDHPAAAVEHEPYRALATGMWDHRAQIRAQHTPAADAAVAIVDAICDDGGPLRHGCDPLSRSLLDAWRSVAGDEAWLRPMLRGFTG